MVKPFESLESPFKDFVINLSDIAKEKNALFLASPDGTSAIFQMEHGPVIQIHIDGYAVDRLQKEELHPTLTIGVPKSACFDKLTLKRALGLNPRA